MIESFDKYDKYGAYHWKECDRRYANYLTYNPPLVARYQIVVDTFRRLGGGKNVLDVGCGDGYLMAQLASHATRVVGVEFESKAVEFARAKLQSSPNCEVVQDSCYKLPFANGDFDCSTSTDVIEHLTEPKRHLSEICRVLKPDGVLILTTPRRQEDRPVNACHVTEFKPEELTVLLRQFFAEVQLAFYWPIFWTRIYNTRLGWRVLKILSIQLCNPFLNKQGTSAEKFTEILAVCRRPFLK